MNGQLCPSAKAISGRPFFRKFSGRPFFWKTFGRTFFRKKNVDFQKNSRKRSGRSVFRKFSGKKGLPEYFLLLPEEGCSGSYFVWFFKMLYFSNYLLLINKLSYKISNIIIHKLLLVNIIMTNICNSFFTRM